MGDKLLETIGTRIEELRIEKGKSRDKMEEECNLPSQLIRHIERKPRPMSFDVILLCRIANYFDVDVEYLLGKQDCKRRDTADASHVTGLSYEAVEVLKSIDHLENIHLFHALSAFICSPSFIPFMVQISNFCTPHHESIPDLGFSYTEVTNASVQKYVTQSLEEAKKQCEKKMAWYKEVLPAIQVYAGNLAHKEKEEGKQYSDERIMNEVIKPIGLDTDGQKLFMDLLNHYRNKQGKVE